MFKLDLDHDPPEFCGVVWDKEYRGFIFRWFAQTSIENVTWTRLVVVGLCWPPIQHFCGFIAESESDNRR